MKKEDTCSKFIISVLVSLLILTTSVGTLFTTEALGSYRLDDKLTADNEAVLGDLQLDSTQPALTISQGRRQVRAIPQFPCSDHFDAQVNPVSKLAYQYTNSCNSQNSGRGVEDTDGFLALASNELQGKICQASIQDQIEWNYKGNRRWASRNLEKICKSAEFSLQPGVCFQQVMHGGVDHGGGTRWKWQDALNLCAGTMNSTATIDCFSKAISRQLALARAIEQCRVKR